MLKLISLILISFNAAWGLTPKALKIYEFGFKPQQTIYIHAGSRALLKFSPIPANIDMVQISLAHNRKSPKAELIGPRTLIIKDTTISLDIPIQIQAISNPREAQYPIELKLKLFRTHNNRHEEVESLSNFVRLIVCGTNEQKVCGAIMKSCRSTNCVEQEIQENFLNFCEMEKAGARLINYGECPEANH